MLLMGRRVLCSRANRNSIFYSFAVSPNFSKTLGRRARKQTANRMQQSAVSVLGAKKFAQSVTNKQEGGLVIKAAIIRACLRLPICTVVEVSWKGVGQLPS